MGPTRRVAEILFYFALAYATLLLGDLGSSFTYAAF